MNQKDIEARDAANQVEIVGGKLDIIIICPKCGIGVGRTIDYRIVEISAIVCEHCAEMFSAKVQNCFEPALAYSRGEWVSVEDRLPEKPRFGAGSYIVAYESDRAKGIVEVPARFRGNGEFVWADGSADPINTDYRRVIAWRTIPRYPPQEQQPVPLDAEGGD